MQLVKLAKVLESKGLKFLKNIKTRWLSILLPMIRVKYEYKVMLVKIHLENKTSTSGQQRKSCQER
jgi:hypothetical protein